MLFRGSAQYPSTSELNHAIELLGDGLQGGTTREFSLYTTEAPAENSGVLLGVLADFFQNPRFSEIEKEKRIVLEEIREEVDERGRETGADNLTRMALLGSHPLAHPILGRPKDLASASPEKLRNFFARHYRPENMVIVAAGALEPKAFFELLEQVWGSQRALVDPSVQVGRAAPTKRVRRPGGAPKLVLQAGKVRERMTFRRQAGSQVDVTLSFLGRGEEDPRRITRLALERVLDDGLASRLQRRLCERRGLLYDISLAVDSCSDVSFFDLGFRIEPSGLIPALSEVFAEFRQLSRNPVPPAELERVKSRMKREVRLMFETPRYLAARVAETLVLELPTPVGRAEWLAKIDEITPESICREAARVFQLSGMAGAFEGPVTPTIKRKVLQACAEGLR
jgi:predicted Zn-dependent peptidase